MKDQLLERGIEEVIDRDSLEKKLKSGKKLRIKYGVDPTKPDIHLGHAVAMWKLRRLQEQGHRVIFLIGDYTTKIGDPSGRNSARPMLSDEEIKKNAKTYFKQLRKILDPRKTEIRYNSEWYSKLKFNELIEIAGKFTVANIIERDDFSKRLKSGTDVGLHELLYPLMQAYDSVMLKADVAFCGMDQKFNELAARELQKKMGLPPQDIVMVELLVGTDGKIKMSKSANNYIGISEPPFEIYGKVMSISDDLIIPYFTLVTDLSEGGLEIVKKEMKEGVNPREIKARLAYLLVETYYDSEAAEKVAEEFNKTFRDKQTPQDIPEVKVSDKEGGVLVDFLVRHNLVKSKSEGRRLIEQGGVRVEQKVVEDANKRITPQEGMIIQIGKRKFFRLKMLGKRKKK